MNTCHTWGLELGGASIALMAYLHSGTGRRSGKEMRNYSDLFGSEMGRRPAPTQQRQALLSEMH